ncbi:LysR family transcriptional regulator [Natronospora cellulosivora (SeqCode)]
MSVNLEKYKVFYFTAKYKSFSAAAEELFISQSAVSQAIKQLEIELDSQLFLRTGCRIKLSAEGKVLFKYIEQAYTLILNAEKKIDSIHKLESGELVIGAGDTNCKYYLLDYLQNFHQKYPAVNIKVTNRTTDEIIELLKKGQVDLGIINLPYDTKNIEVIKSREIQDCFVAGKKYQGLIYQQLSLNELSKYPLLLLEEKANTRKYIDKIAFEYGAELKAEIELGSVDLLIEFAKIGLGIACVVEDFVEEELAAGSLFKLNVQEEIPGRSIGIAYLQDIPVSRAADCFIELLT